ncbi:MAG TPA: hypothetical protein VMU71_00660 [Terracidiphilus sp.]|nr:hypothetical protein [Terracidiphilus sp.]
MTTSAAWKRTRIAVWWIVGIAWILGWVLFLVGRDSLRLYAAIVLLICGVFIAVLKWGDRKPSGSEEKR